MNMTLPSEHRTFDVVVVGAGPVGLAAARLLLTHGVSVAVVDPNPIVCHHPRASHLDDETMRTLQTLGAADLEPRFLRQSGWTLCGPDDLPFLELAMPNQQTDQAWYSDYQFHQPDFESRMRGLIAAAGAELLLGWEVASFDQDDTEVRLQLRDRSARRQQEVRGRYVVAADGANSFVRRQLGAEVEDLEGTQTSLIIDIHPFEHPDTLPRDTGFVRCERELPVTYVPILPPLLRFEFMLGAHHDAEAMAQPASVYRLLSRWLEPGTYRILRTDAYEWHARLVHGWRHGRVLLAGDAAHEMPPMLGQGMCSGLRDSMNLAWKLALVVRGMAPAGLLDTYESERTAHVRPYIVESARQSNMIEEFGLGGHPPAISEPQIVERYRPPLGPGLVDAPEGPISQLAPQPRSEDGARLDHVTGYQFSIVGSAEIIAAVTDETRQHWTRLGAVVLADGGPELRDWLSANGASVAVIRPDRYAFALAQDAAGLDDATRELVGRVLKAEVPA